MSKTIPGVAALLAALALAGPARADGDAPVFPHIIPVTSIGAAGAVDDPQYPLVDVLTSAGGDWCEARPPGGVGHPLVIELGEPTVIDAIAVPATSLSSQNAIAKLEVTADGKTFTQVAAAGQDEIVVAIGGAPVSKLRVVVTGTRHGDTDVTCVSRVELRTTPPSAIALGVDARAAAALEPTISAARRAFRTCDAKGLAALARGFTYTTVTEDNDGMKWHPHTYKTAAAVKKACKGHKLAAIATSLDESLTIRARGPGKLEVGGGSVTWSVVLVDGAWRIESVGEGT